MASMMQAYYAIRREYSNNPDKRIDPSPCLIRNTNAQTMVVQLHYVEWNSQCPPSTSIDGVLIRCYFNRSEPMHNYIVAYGSTKSQNKRSLLQFLERFPLCTFEPSTIQQPTTKANASVSPSVTTMVLS